MNQEKLKRINEISKEVSEIENFLDYMARGTGRLKVLSKKPVYRNIFFRRPSYGVLENYDYTVPKELTSEVLKVIQYYKDKLIVEQERLWGGE